MSYTQLPEPHNPDPIEAIRDYQKRWALVQLLFSQYREERFWESWQYAFVIPWSFT